MGWSYRKSLGFGPFRVNLSRSGVGYSIGGRGFRTGISGAGRRYSSMSIPGTGLRYTTRGCGCHGCLTSLLLLLAVYLVFKFLSKGGW